MEVGKLRVCKERMNLSKKKKNVKMTCYAIGTIKIVNSKFMKN